MHKRQTIQVTSVDYLCWISHWEQRLPPTTCLTLQENSAHWKSFSRGWTPPTDPPLRLLGCFVGIHMVVDGEGQPQPVDDHPITSRLPKGYHWFVRSFSSLFLCSVHADETSRFSFGEKGKEFLGQPHRVQKWVKVCCHLLKTHLSVFSNGQTLKQDFRHRCLAILGPTWNAWALIKTRWLFRWGGLFQVGPETWDVFDCTANRCQLAVSCDLRSSPLFDCLCQLQICTAGSEGRILVVQSVCALCKKYSFLTFFSKMCLCEAVVATAAWLGRTLAPPWRVLTKLQPMRWVGGRNRLQSTSGKMAQTAQVWQLWKEINF